MQVHGITRRLLPSAAAEAVQAQPRTDEFGGLHVRNEQLAWVQEGSYFKCLNATMGTGVAHTVQTGFSDTANVLFVMVNGSATRKVLPHYLRCINTAAGASTTSSHLAVVLDTANRYSAGGTDLTGNIVCADSGQGPASVVSALRYNCTAAAAVAKRQVARLALKTQAAPCWTVGDEFRLVFNGNSTDSTLVSGAAAISINRVLGPVQLGGQNHSLLIHMWNVANAATPPNWEFEWAWWER